MSIQKNARFWDRMARKYAAETISDQAGYERTLTRTKDYLKATDAVLEFGCGTGSTALRLAPSTGSMIASDISAEMIAIAREKQGGAPDGRLEFVRAALEQLDYPDDAFDVVLAFNALHLMRNLKDSLWRTRRLLRPGGLFISKTPCLSDMSPMIRAAIPVMKLFGKAPEVSFFTARQLEAAIAAEGFEIVEVARHGTKGKDTRPFIVARKA